MKYIKEINFYSIILAVFFLPVSLNINNIFLVLFIISSIVLFFKGAKEGKIEFRKNIAPILLSTIPFWLNALGLIYTDELKKGIDYTVRAIPFLFLPLIGIYRPSVIKQNYREIGYSLVVGCLFVACYSWVSTISEIIKENRPIKDLFGPVYSHHNLVKSLKLHAAYLSICIYTAIAFLITQYKSVSKKYKITFSIIIVILSLFMFHLLSRNAIIFYLASSFFFLVYYKKWKVLVTASVLIFTLGFLAYNVKHNYLRDRIFNNLNFFEKETKFSKKDDRFDRLEASYEVFMKSPIIGHGTAGESEYRREIFKRNRDLVAYKENYNAHNQFFEYLSTYGIIGGVLYFVFFGYLFFVAVKRKNGFVVFALSGLFLACLTESVFERSQGVVYMSLLIALLFSFNHNFSKNLECKEE